ncbi:MAG: DUF5130 family protein [Propionibacteriaceae bacterium]
MRAGEYFSAPQVATIRKAMSTAERVSGLSFSVYVGVAEEDAQRYARRLHAALADPDHSVLVLCDPEFRALEIVTGAAARRNLDDTAVGLAAATMQTSFAVGDISGGLVAGINQLGDAARAPQTLHARD